MNLDSKFFINIGPDATFRPSGSVKTSPEDVDHMIDYLKENHIDQLAIYLHGGLVDEAAGMDCANRMKDVFLEVNSHPVTLVWETGLIETLKDDLNTIANSKLFTLLLKVLIKVIARKIGSIDGSKSFQELDDEQIENELNTTSGFKFLDTPLRSEIPLYSSDVIEEMTKDVNMLVEKELSKSIAYDIKSGEDLDYFEKLFTEEIQGFELLCDEMKNISEESDEKGLGLSYALTKIIGKIVLNTIRRFWNKTDHGFKDTIVEEIIRTVYLADVGNAVWAVMKDKAELMWADNSGLSGLELHPGSFLIEGLIELKNELPELKIDLIGHSAGAIAICYLLKSIRGRNLDIGFRHIVFMAPACRHDLFIEQIVEQPDLYETLRIFTMADEYETEDPLVNRIPWFYGKSLLYFISGVLEDEVDAPLVGMVRYLTGETPYDNSEQLTVRDFLLYNPEHLVLSNSEILNPNATYGYRSSAIDHGDFDNDPLTLTSIQHILDES